MFNAGILTERGKKLDAKVTAGQAALEFARIELGSGIYRTDESVESSVGLKKKQQEFLISSITIIGGNTVRLRTVINNNGVTEGYHISEMGVIAMDPDDGEILYSVILGNQDVMKQDYQPSIYEFAGATATLDILTATENAEKVTIMAGEGVVASAEDVRELTERVEDLMRAVNSAGRVRFGGQDTELSINDTLFIIEEDSIPAAFKGAVYTNLVFGTQSPDGAAENWAELEPDYPQGTVGNAEEGILNGKLAVSEEPTSDAAFLQK